jgi:hypothetical protein
MGSFAITYDDFTGGHYMGNRSTAQPSNTWTGNNTVLDPRGNLIASKADLLATVTGPSATGVNKFKIHGVFSHLYGVLVFYSLGTTAYVRNIGTLGNVTNPLGGSTTLSGVPTGFMAPDQSTNEIVIYYVIGSSGNIRKFTYSISGIIGLSTDTLITSGTNVETSLYKYKYRLLGIGDTGSIRNRLYYSDPTMTTWGATDYYEFPGQITNVVPRSNDLVVTTTAGIYSVTGVLGESINIQEIYTYSELSQGMSNAVGYGRDFVYLNDYLDSMNGKIYAGLGVTKTLIGTVDLVANNPLNIAVINPGLVTVMSNTGYAYVMDSEGSWARFQFSEWDPADVRFNQGSGSVGTAALSLDDLPGNMFPAEPAIKPYDSDTSDSIMYLARADQTDIKIYRAFHTLRDPLTTTASVTLAEYWHSKQMIVREVVVEVEYVSTTTNASVAVNIIPVGAVDINTATAPSMTSSTITAPSETTASTIIHRFQVNNAGRAYGFKPNIEHKGVRIRRVICVCED